MAGKVVGYSLLDSRFLILVSGLWSLDTGC
jgi:hypothetical protein